MTFCRNVFLGALLGLGALSAAQAQVGVYGTVTGENLNGINCQDAQNKCASNGTVKPYGGSFGAYYDFRNYGPVLFGFEVRGSVLNDSKSAYSYQASGDLIRHYSLLGGVRGSMHVPIKILHPYAGLSAGLGRTDATQPPPAGGALSYLNFTQIQGNVGLDLQLFQNFDFRLIEFGAGEMFGPSSHSFQSIGIGFVIHTSRNP